MRNRKQFVVSGPVGAAIALLFQFTIPVSADTGYTGTGWLTDVPVLPIICTPGSGQVLLRGNAHAIRVVGSDPCMTGQRLVFANGDYLADGSAIIYGTAYQQVGTWDSTGTNFTPSGGLWEMSYRGVMLTDYSLQLTLAGLGRGGSIDGLRLEETVTRAPASGPIDFSVPYDYTGTIKQQSLDTNAPLDNFDDNNTNAPVRWLKYGPGQVTLIETNMQFTVRGYWPGTNTVRITDSYAWGMLPVTSWNLAPGQSIEWRVDLVGMNEHADMAALCVGNSSTFGIYSFFKWRDFIGVCKFVGGKCALLSFESAPIRNSDVVLSLTEMLVSDTVWLIPRVLDKNKGNAVLYERVVKDTPSADPTVSSSQVAELSGMYLTVTNDVAGAPYKAGNVLDLECWQYNDGTRPAAEVTYDNLQMLFQTQASGAPVLGIEQAMRLTWLATYGLNYAVQCAPTPHGPWSALSLPVIDGESAGLKQVVVPIKQVSQFYRLVLAP